MIKAMIRRTYLSLYHTGLFNYIPDEQFLKFEYRMATGKKLRLNPPISYNEKLQWIKLYDRNPLYPLVVDKYLVRDFVRERVGEEYLIPLLGRWDAVAHIKFDELPNSFVLKCNHDSGGIYICPDKANADWEKGKSVLQKHLKQNHYYLSREWAYKDVVPCIIAEKYMQDRQDKELRDYKFFCFNGVPKLIQVDFDRFTDHKRNFYTLDWEFIDVGIKCPNDRNVELKRPKNLTEMIEVAKKLSAGFPQVRVDLYSVDGRTYFGEMTLYHGGGYERFTPEEFGVMMGNWIDLDGIAKA